MNVSRLCVLELGLAAPLAAGYHTSIKISIHLFLYAIKIQISNDIPIILINAPQRNQCHFWDPLNDENPLGRPLMIRKPPSVSIS